jgi:PfaB family protein
VVNLEVSGIGLGNINGKKELEEFLYSGGNLADELRTSSNTACDPVRSDEKNHWLVNPDFQQIYMKEHRGQVTILPESSSWIIEAMNFCQDYLTGEASSLILAAADTFGNFIKVKVSVDILGQGYCVCAKVLDVHSRLQETLIAKERVGSIEILDPIEMDHVDEIISQELVNYGLNHTPVITSNPVHQNSALTNMVQLTRLLLGIEYRTHYGQPLGTRSSYGYSRSVPWFSTSKNSKRSGLMMSFSTPNIHALEVMEIDQFCRVRTMNRKQFLINAAGDSEQELFSSLERIQGLIEQKFDIAEIEKELFSTNKLTRFIVCLVAADNEQLREEIAQAKNGIPSSLLSGREWQSRGGSYFTPAPLGAAAQVAFVYPGAFNSYVGMGAELLRRFPFLHDWLSTHTEDPSEIYQAENLFPKSWGSADADELGIMQMALLSKPLSMLFTGTAIAGMYTYLLEEVFGIHPGAAYGYSLGEITMFFATGFWQKTQRVKQEITSSPLYKDRIAGTMNAVREFWDQVGLSYEESTPIWSNMILMTNIEKVKDAVEREPLVYLTHINTQRQVVIGGEPGACQRVVEELGCMRFPIPVNYPMHCPPVASEYGALRDLVLQPIEGIPSLTYYGSFNNAPYIMESTEIAETIAGGLVNPVDFDQLTNTVFNEGNSIFIEVGARSNCAKWIERSLKSKLFCAVSVNQAEVPDEICLMKVIARLVSHGKQVTLPFVEKEEQ